MLDSRYVRFVVETGKSSTIAASKLSGLDRFTIAADDGGLDSTAYVVVRDGDDLVMLFADGTRVVIEDYFTSTASFAFDGLGQAVELPLDAQPIGTVGDKALYAFSGDVDGARTILLESRGFTALEPLLDDAAIAALPAGVGLPLMLPLALGLVAAAGGSTAAAVIQTTIKGLFLAGPIIDGNGLSVDIFDNKGNLLARDVPLNEDGSFSVTLEGTYTSVIAILRDGNEAADYRDEATGLPRDLTAQLMSVGTGQPQGDGTTLVNLNINPITTVAARNAGLGQDGTIPEGGLSDAQINDANKATADAFGLSDVNAVAPLNIFDPAFNDTDGDVSESEKYGQILAMMSGLDQKNNGDQQAAIEQIATTLRNAPDADTAQQQVKDNLTEGAVEFEFKNKGGTENEANLLSSPALGIQNTPDVDTEGTSQAPAVTALLDDLASQPDEGDATPITAAQLQQAVNAANALQQLVALGADDAVPTDISDVLDESSLELLGLTGLTPAPSPYLDEFLSVLKAAADDGSATDSVAELQALLDGVIAAGLTPSQTVEPNADGTITVSGQTVPGASVTVAYPDGTSVTVEADENGAYSATSAAPQTSGSVSVSAADSAGNTSAPVVEAYQDETPPVAPTAVLEVNGDGTLSVSGTGEPGSTVTTVFPDGSTGTAVVADDGSYGPITSAAAQPSTNVKVTQQDEAGNLSPAAVDETAPFGPSITHANAAGLSGTAETGSIVTLFDDSEPPVAIASTTVGEDGNWSIPAAAFPGGTTDGFAGSVTATDAAGNVSDPTTVPAIDGKAPAAPGVDAANADGLSGTGTAGDVIVLLDNNGDPVLDGKGNPVTAVVDGDGNWAIPASAFPGGTTDGFAGAVTATDAAGNESAPAAIAAIDGTAPEAPGVDAANADGLSGTGTAGDVITLFDDSEPPVAIASTTVGEDGSWSIPAADFPDGTTDGFAGAVTATDEAGNESAPAAIAAIDGTAPAAPGVDAANADGLSGTGTAGDVITLFDNSEPPVAIATATVGEDGTWSIPASAFPGSTTDGFAGSVTATDAAGNESAPAAIAAIDGTAPDAPGVDAANADGLSGTGTAGDVITLFDNSEPPVAIASTTVGEDGSWSIPASAFPGGTTDGFAGAVTATDAAGNESAPAAIAAIDGTAPEAPGVDAANADGVSGTGTAGDVITLFDDSEPPVAIASTTVGEDGTWSIPAADFPGGTTDGFAGAVTATDAAGNESAPAAIAAIDGTAPEAPVVEGANADGLSGTGTAGDVITLFDNSEPPVAIASTTVGEDGSWSIPAADFPGGTTDGFAGAVTATDEAGNESAPAAIAAIDGTAPEAPGVDAANADGLSGTGTAGDVITLFDDSEPPVAIASTTVGEDGTWSIPALAFPGGTTDGFAGSVTATDAAGNESAPAAIAAIDGTAPDAASVAQADGNVAIGLPADAETATISYTPATPENANPVDLVLTRDENGDWVLPEGAPAGAAVDANGTLTIPNDAFASGTGVDVVVADAAGNAASSSLEGVIDNTAPTVTISDDSASTATGDVTFTFTFSEAVTGFSADNLTVTNGTKGTFTPVSSTEYTLVVTPTANSAGDITVATSTTGVTDAAGNTATAPADYVQAFDTAAPTVTISDDTASTATGDVTFTFTFSEAVTGFSADKLTVTNGTKGTFTPVSSTEYTLVVTPTANSAGDITVATSTTGVTDAAGNTATAPADYVQAFDTAAPTVTISDDTASTATGDVTFTFTFSEAVTGFSADNLTVTNGTKGTFAAVSGTEYTLVVTPTANSAGDITVATSTTGVTDAAGNTATAPADYVQAFDTAAPTATVAIAATDLNDGANTSDVTITFSEAVTGFDVNDLTITNGTIASVSTNDGGITWTGTFTATDDIEANGSVTLTGAYTDVAGNTGATGASDTVAIDTRVLAPTINAGITDQANTVSGTGEAGAVVTVNTLEGGVSTAVGTATVWTDGTWSFVADSPIADGAVLVATQQDKAGNLSFEAQVSTFTDTDGDGTADTSDTDDDGDGINDDIEGQFESTVNTSASTALATSTISGTPTAGYTSVTQTNADGVVTVVATAAGEAGSNGNTGGLGTKASFTVQFDPVATETFENAVLNIEIDRFDDGLFVAIDGTTIVNFNANDWYFDTNNNLRTNQGLNIIFDTDGDGLWSPFANPAEGNPVLRIDTATGSVQLLVDKNPDLGGGREDVLAYIKTETDVRSGTPNPTPNALPTLDWLNGVTVTTAYNNADGGGSIGQQRITVEGQFTGANEIDGDKILNWVDIDTDNDRIWDKYEGVSDTDTDGVAAYRDTDSDGNGTADGVQASLSASDIADLENQVTTNNDGYILLSDDSLLLRLSTVENEVSNLEYIDMDDGTNAQTVRLDPLALINVTGAPNELILVGDENDIADTYDFEDTGKDISIEGQVFSVYEGRDSNNTLATLIIDDDITVWVL